MFFYLLSIGTGGAVGALARYYAGRLIMERWGRVFPLGTFFVNITGSFLLCMISTWATRGGILSPYLEVALSTGFLGAYTTFSTFAYEAIKLLEDREAFTALTYVIGSILVGLGAGWLGLLAGFHLLF
ncbi:MAG: fluoride efflux transporter CrcB [Bacillota bacterium]|nr:fluoride efflux transporter CrcB [Bacillota bacterium]